jgi:hypothetical protein
MVIIEDQEEAYMAKHSQDETEQITPQGKKAKVNPDNSVLVDELEMRNAPPKRRPGKPRTLPIAHHLPGYNIQ